jgi:RNA polymerase sigma-70 factor (sigma-E family)
MDKRQTRAFEGFAAESGAELLRIATLLTSDPHTAEDVYQETLQRLAARWQRVNNPKAFCRRVMYNIVVDQIRARARRPLELRLHDAGERSDPRAADQHDSVELWPTLRTALDSLTVQQRTVIALRYLDDCSETETAKLLGISVGTVKSTASRSIAHLRAFPGLADLFTTTDFTATESML